MDNEPGCEKEDECMEQSAVVISPKTQISGSVFAFRFCRLKVCGFFE